LKSSDNNKKPKISVLIPAFNTEATIRETIESVLNQTVCSDEIIVMDDGSTDKTGEIAASYVPRVTVLRQSNRGVSAARNALIQQASGDLIAMLDADDLWLPQYLEIQLESYQKHPNAVASFTGFINMYDDSQISERHRKIAQCKSSLLDPLDLLEFYAENSGMIIPSFCVIRSDSFRALGDTPFPTNLRITQDSYLWYRIALLGPFVRVYVKAGLYRILPTSLSHDRLATFEDRVKTLETVYDVYRRISPPAMLRLAKKHLVMNYRQAAKYHLGVSDLHKARSHLFSSLGTCFSFKSLVLLIISFLPRRLQPRWPCRYRTLKQSLNAIDRGRCR